MMTTEPEIFSSFARILQEVAGIPAGSVTYEADISDDLGVSSLSLVEVIIAAEEEFGVEIPDEALKDLKTVHDVVRFVQGSDVGLAIPEGAAPGVAAT